MSRRGVILALTFTLLVLLLNGIISFANTRAIVTDQRDVIQTDAVLTALQRALITVDDAETGQRGYIITGRAEYLAPYLQARKHVVDRMRILSVLTKGNPSQRRRMTTLDQLVRKKVAELNETINLRRSGHYERALGIILSDRGKRLMARIRKVISRLEKDERAALALHHADAQASDQRAMVTTVIATIANACLVFFLFYLAWRGIRKRGQILERERAFRADVQRVAAEREAILAQIADGVVVVDATGAVTFVNEAARELFALPNGASSAGDFVNSLRMYHRDGTAGTEEEVTFGRALREGETVHNAEARVLDAGGRDLILQGSVAPVVAADGTSLGAVAVFRDVTAERALEDDKDNFLSSAAHDLKTPLATVKGIAQLLQRRARRSEAPGLEPFLEGLDRIDVTASRMAGLITEMLDISRLEMGRPIDLVRRAVNFDELVRDRVREARGSQNKHRIKIESRPRDIVGVWDKSRLERVIDNILSNAIKYSPMGGVVTVRVECEDRAGGTWVTLSVADQGVGIPKGDLPKVFERFHRGSNVMGAIPGTGIGLAGAKHLIEQHGGTIAVASREGQGTTVTLELPLASREESSFESVPAAPEAAGQT